MNCELRIIIYMCAMGLDTQANDFLINLWAIAKQHATDHPDEPIAFAIHAAKYWNNPEDRDPILRTGERCFETNQPLPLIMKDDFSCTVNFRNPGEKETLDLFLEKVKTRSVTAAKNVFILWGHGGVYFTFSAVPDVRFAKFHTYLAGYANKYLKWFKNNAPKVIADNYKIDFGDSGALIADDILTNHFDFYQQQDGRLIPNPVLKPKTDVGTRHVKEFRSWDGLFESDSTEIEFWQLTMDEIREKINKYFTDGIDILVFDNCLMQCADNNVFLQGTVSWLVGSQDYLYSDDITTAWEVKSLLANFRKPPSEMAGQLVQAFTASQPPQRVELWAYSHTNTSKVADFTAVFQNLCSLLIPNIAQLRPAIASARSLCNSFTEDGLTPGRALALSLVDVCWFLQNLNRQLTLHAAEIETVLLGQIQQAIHDNLSVLCGNSVTCFISSNRFGQKRKPSAIGAAAYGAQGVSILFPKDKDDLDASKNSPAYASLFDVQSSSPFMEQTGWKRFIQVYCV